MMSLHLYDADPERVMSALQERVQQAPLFFQQAPVVLEIDRLVDESELDMAAILSAVRECQLLPVAARTQHDGLRSQCHEAALPVLRRHEEERDIDAEDESEDDDFDFGDEEEASGDSTKPVRSFSTLVTRPVRSGQQVFARKGDLVVVGACSAGCELIADGNIHVYGALRGRALCGINGNTNARIFCHSLEAELLSIAGHYRILEDIPQELLGKPAQIWLDGEEKLHIEPLEK